jgi:2-polyprenyl-6-methoxyphenol hydroxylase-like FAD-dependent oxidoreductase
MHGHAIIIGSSIAGLLAARALTDHFERVTLIERDTLPSGATERAGVPQSKHPHNVLTRGMSIMERFFPGLEADMRAADVKFANWGKHVRTLTANGWLQNIETELYSPVISRALLEWLLRQRVLALSGVSLIESAAVGGLLTDPTRQTVRGVRVQPRGAGTQPYDLEADFVVDASGRSSKAPDWLDSLGYGRPQETVVDPKVGYATRLYRKPESFNQPWHILYMPAKAPQTRGGAIFEIEGGIWMVALGGYAEDYPPTDEDGFIAYAKSLPEPDVYEAMKDAQPLGDIAGYRRTNNVMRHYEKMALPARFAVTGDAVCGFNPIYGQGMTAAAMGAVLLSDCVRHAPSPEAVGHTFQKKLAAQNADIWLMSTGEDFRHAATEGNRPNWTGRLVQRYMDELLSVIAKDDGIARRFLHVVNLDQPPTALFQPAVLGALLRHKLAGKRA